MTIKMLYNGVMAKGLVKGIGTVEYGKIYDIPDNRVESLLKNGEWSKVKDDLKQVLSKKVKSNNNNE